ncbi:hypothetical protein GQ600_3636 [Phytophthora cactorum]|nr:hypothetical protein GQ600_3636 [Phytophthora cactorum]
MDVEATGSVEGLQTVQVVRVLNGVLHTDDGKVGELGLNLIKRSDRRVLAQQTALPRRLNIVLRRGEEVSGFELHKVLLATRLISCAGSVCTAVL